MSSAVDEMKGKAQDSEKIALNKAFDEASKKSQRFILGIALAMSAADKLAEKGDRPVSKRSPHLCSVTPKLRLIVSN